MSTTLNTEENLSQGKPKSTCRRPSICQDINNSLVRAIISMKKHGVPNVEIAEEVHRSRERVRQIVKEVAKNFGVEILQQEEEWRFWTISQAAVELGKSSFIIRDLVKSGEVPFRRRNKKILLDKETVGALKDHPKITGKMKCIVCGIEFVVEKGKRKLCGSIACQKRYHRERRLTFLKNESSIIGSLRGWRKCLWQRLQNHIMPEDEKWVRAAEAAKLTGLSLMQIYYLRKCGLVAIRPFGKSREGTPYTLYSASQMETIRQVCQVK